MDLNCPVSIEQVANGYVVRPLNESRESALTGRARLCPDLLLLKEWLLNHFRTTSCPQCGSVASRSEWMLFVDGVVVLRCSKCRMATVEGSEEWLSMKSEDGSMMTREENDSVDSRLREMALRLRR